MARIKESPELDIVREEVRKEYEEKFEIWKVKDLADLKQQQDAEIQKQVGELFKKWLDEQKPPSLEDIKTLLDQEYHEITIRVPLVQDDGKSKVEEFILRELPQSVERRFYRQFKDRVKQYGPQLSAFVQRNMDVPFEKMMENFLETFDGAFDVLADAVVMTLNPFGKREGITAQWVQDNISSNRQYSIVLAQIEVNRLRDFFSRLFQSGQKASTMFTPPSIRPSRQPVL